VIGTLVGGLVLNSFWWGSVFFVSVPIAAVALICVSLLCPDTKEEEDRKLDLIGSLLSVAGFGGLLYGIIEGPEKGWSSVHFVGGLLFAVVGLVGFVLWGKRTKEPMLDMSFFANRRFGIGALGVTFVFLAMFAFFFLISQYFQSVRSYSPLRAGFATLPFAVAMIALSPRGPAFGTRFGTKRVITTGFFTLPIGLMLLSFVDSKTPYVYVAAALIVTAIGPALCIPTLSSGIVLSLPLDRAGVGSAVNDTTREVGGAIGIAVLGSILNARYRNGMSPLLAKLPAIDEQIVDAAQRGVSPLAGFVRSAQQSPQFVERMPQLEALLNTARVEFVKGMQMGLRITAVLTIAVAFVIARHYPRTELQMTPSQDPARG
jgi:EmrB/QacA subfamily drug resistance transporter